MKGLIIKDILNLKNYMKQLILVLIFFIAYGIFLKNGTFVGTMITLMLSMQVITTMSYDEYAKWDKYALTMNINRKDIDKISKEDIVGIRKNTFGCEVMVSDRNKYENMGFVIDKTNLEEIILFKVRGQK